MCFCVTSPVSFPFPFPTLEGNSHWLSFLRLFCTFKITYEEAVITADTAKKFNSALHATTHSGHDWVKVYQAYNLSCNIYDYLCLKKAFYCLNYSK